VAIDTSVAAIRILNVVIVILRSVVCGEFAPAITATLSRTFPEDFFDNDYVGVASRKAHQVNFTLARTAQMTSHQSRSVGFRHASSSFQSRDDWRRMAMRDGKARAKI
jgi:hypothetical protein